MPFSLQVCCDFPIFWLWKASPFIGSRSLPCGVVTSSPLTSTFFLLAQFHGHLPESMPSLPLLVARSARPDCDAICSAHGQRRTSIPSDLANAYGSVPHQLLWKTLEAHHVPQPVIHILQEYFSGFMMRFSTKTYTTRWVPLEVGIAMGCTISHSLFVLAMQILLKAAGSNIPEAHIGKGVYMPPIKAFMDDTTLIMNRKKVVQNTLDKLNNLLGWCRMAFKPA